MIKKREKKNILDRLYLFDVKLLVNFMYYTALFVQDYIVVA